MQEQKLCALCTHVAAPGSAPRLAALLVQDAQYDDNNEQVHALPSDAFLTLLLLHCRTLGCLHLPARACCQLRLFARVACRG